MKHINSKPIVNQFSHGHELQLLKNCSRTTLHDIVQDERTFWKPRFFDFRKFQIFSRSLDEYVDGYGYNFLHSSLIGDNHNAFLRYAI